MRAVGQWGSGAVGNGGVGGVGSWGWGAVGQLEHQVVEVACGLLATLGVGRVGKLRLHMGGFQNGGCEGWGNYTGTWVASTMGLEGLGRLHWHMGCFQNWVWEG